MVWSPSDGQWNSVLLPYDIHVSLVTHTVLKQYTNPGIPASTAGSGRYMADTCRGVDTCAYYNPSRK